MGRTRNNSERPERVEVVLKSSKQQQQQQQQED